MEVLNSLIKVCILLMKVRRLWLKILHLLAFKGVLRELMSIEWLSSLMLMELLRLLMVMEILHMLMLIEVLCLKM